MIKRKFTTLLLFLLALNLTAQEDHIKKIRKIYTEYNQKIDLAKKDGAYYEPPRFVIKNVQNKPALGPVEYEITYYYDDNYNMSGENAEHLQIESSIVLRKVVYTEGMPSYTDYQEYLYDTDGSLLFCYSKLTGYTCGEKRFYFKNGKLIKVKFNPIAKAEKGCQDDEFPTFTRYTGKLTNDDLEWERWVQKKAKNHKKALMNLFKGTN